MPFQHLMRLPSQHASRPAARWAPRSRWCGLTSLAVIFCVANVAEQGQETLAWASQGIRSTTSMPGIRASRVGWFARLQCRGGPCRLRAAAVARAASEGYDFGIGYIIIVPFAAYLLFVVFTAGKDIYSRVSGQGAAKAEPKDDGQRQVKLNRAFRRKLGKDGVL
eukprot:CAMPEP_0117527138 /NCGR_PEP_ID=MMETSP0784-20121206/36643_1 /TAXON_ID=39447 /ORGANISM="" /LENGTH=164 /DNA_ID=CAMNT_0005323381 /DNA_START=39 /DNA_END=533 /DNA_ORIENTATION=-